ncbi:MAG: GNAT family N-acetyltransferase [Chloroflexi bacterium]|nr:GNAT family N-acetyltransferase [Chloroflexota bacterium]
MPVVTFTDGHLPALLDFVESLNDWGSQGRDLGRKIFQELLEQPWLDLQTDCWVLEDQGVIRGFCLIHREPPIGRSVIQMEVAPSLAGGVHEGELLDTAVGHSRKWGAKVAHLCIPAGPASSDRAAMLEERGFTVIRSYTNMLWQGGHLPLWSTANGYQVRPYQPGDEGLLTQVQNAAFAESWGFCPNTVEQIKYRADMSNTRHQGILFLIPGQQPPNEQPVQGENPAGYCWTCLIPVPQGLRGIIGMIGVVPEFRGRGVSKSILMAGMDYLQSAGATNIGLEVDSSNTPAIRLYDSVGFEKTSELHWFELVLSRLNPGNC